MAQFDQNHFFENEEDKRKCLASGKKSVSILFVGRLGKGKSSLVNAFLGEEKAQEGAGGESVTDEITSYERSFHIDAINEKRTFILWDTPGLNDPLKSDEHERQMYLELHQIVKKVDLVLYCLDMRGRLEKDDVKSFAKLIEIAGPDIWKQTAFILTFCNRVPSNDEPLSGKTIQEHFNGVLSSWINVLRKALIEKLEVSEDIVHEIPIIPVGKQTDSDEPTPNDTNWFSCLWFDALKTMKPEAQATMYAIADSDNRILWPGEKINDKSSWVSYIKPKLRYATYTLGPPIVSGVTAGYASCAFIFQELRKHTTDKKALMVGVIAGVGVGIEAAVQVASKKKE